jgi:UDP-N-acetyl-D-glucosamine dehydrogenase
MPFYPGPGVGGHCIPLDPYYLASKAREFDFHTRFIELAAEINEHMPYYIVSRIIEALNASGKSLKGANVFALGVAYKKDIDDTRESPSLRLIQLLSDKGAKVSYNDPFIPEIKLSQGSLTSIALTKENLSSADCVVIATDHSCYNMDEVVAHAKLVFDTRGVTKGLRGNNIVRLGE